MARRESLCVKRRLCVKKGPVWEALYVYYSAVNGELSIQNGEEHSWLQGTRSLSFKCEVEHTLCVRCSWS